MVASLLIHEVVMPFSPDAFTDAVLALVNASAGEPAATTVGDYYVSAGFLFSTLVRLLLLCLDKTTSHFTSSHPAHVCHVFLCVLAFVFVVAAPVAWAFTIS